MSEPLGYLITLRTYGTWLHGDERGSIDREHNVYGTPLLPPDHDRNMWEQQQLAGQPLVFDDRMRQVVAAAVADQCRYRGWELAACAVRSNHVHVVIVGTDRSPERVARELKGRATRWLREAGCVAPEARMWADGASTRYLWKPREINAAAAYVRDGQDVPH